MNCLMLKDWDNSQIIWFIAKPRHKKKENTSNKNATVSVIGPELVSGRSVKQPNLHGQVYTSIQSGHSHLMSDECPGQHCVEEDGLRCFSLAQLSHSSSLCVCFHMPPL